MQVGYFNTDEFKSADGRESPWGETVVDPALLEKLNEIREAYGKPVVINSGYRSPEHNAAVGGVKNSMHVQGKAADIRPTTANAADLPELQRICDELNAEGGVGFYNTFCHVDVRGRHARWDNRK